ncbi:MAG: hypothetical protein IJO52_06545 [Clostridia bacterium]|nr:hypothetical protein [Clostridia bacterium]
MKTKLLFIAAILVIAAMLTLTSCNKEQPADGVVEGTEGEAIELPVNEYDVEDAAPSTPESREKLEEKYKELQTLYNLAVDTVAKTEGDIKEQVKDLGATYIDLLRNKISNPDYAQFEAFVQDAIKEIDSLRGQLISLVPSIAG